MKKSAAINNIFAILIGLFFLVMAVLGFFHEQVLGIFTTNFSQAIIHLILGLTAVCLGILKMSRGYCGVIGLALLVFGILRLVPEIDELIIYMFNANEPLAYLNILLGAMALLVYFVGKTKKIKPTEGTL